eukprot:12429420-Alexandrium_andersonii.AAC.1
MRPRCSRLPPWVASKAPSSSGLRTHRGSGNFWRPWPWPQSACEARSLASSTGRHPSSSRVVFTMSACSLC